MSAAPALQTLEVALAEARELRRTWDADAGYEHLVAAVPSRRDPTFLYEVSGHSHGRDARCTCPGFAYRQRCAHAAAFILIWEELERQHYAATRPDGCPGYPDRALLDLLAWYDGGDPTLSPEQRLRRNGIRAALAARGIHPDEGRTLAERLATVERGRQAKALLFEEGA